MTKTQMNVRIDKELDNRLDALAKRTGRTKSFYAVLAIKEFLEDQENYFLAKDSLAEFHNSTEAAIDMKTLIGTAAIDDASDPFHTQDRQTDRSTRQTRCTPHPTLFGEPRS